jgi:hypothetical protein
MISIASAANTEVPCYLALIELGFDVIRQQTGEHELWIAEKLDVKIVSGEGLCNLLGLAKLIEMRDGNWQATDGEIDHFLKHFYKGVS